jgi:hypothetical protein
VSILTIASVSERLSVLTFCLLFVLIVPRFDSDCAVLTFWFFSFYFVRFWF